MTPKEYIKEALRTESSAVPLNDDYYPEITTDRLLHAAMGLSTESGELLDALKKHLFYRKPLDTTNLKEEMGDLFWYLAILADALGTTFEAEMERNIAKLKARYPRKFTSENAINRDLATERKVLEQ
jgi:NTP pyrophosphatase (non-canonical NTP hydrolase)